MAHLSRRAALFGLGAATLTACDNSHGAGAGLEIDRKVTAALDHMRSSYPDTVPYLDQAAGVLVIPRMAELGMIYGGGYGEGALRIGGATVDYYSAAQASFGLQLGGQVYSFALCFMTPEALRGFRMSPGWSGGVDAEVTVDRYGRTAATSTDLVGQDVVAIVFNQEGLRAGATVSGTKYTRILR